MRGPQADLKAYFIAVLLGAGVILGGCEDRTPEQVEPEAAEIAEQSKASPGQPAAVDAERLSNPQDNPGQWMSYSRDYTEQRFSPLTRITDENVSELGLAWYVDLNEPRGIEATPVVVDGVMYTTSAWSVVYAINAQTGEMLWKHDPEVPKEWGAYACCDVVNRGVAVWKGKVYVGTLDGRLVALDAATGDVVFDVNTIDRTKPYTITGAPRAVAGKIIIGHGGADYGVRGYVTAYDAETGEQAWRFYTVPGNPADGFLKSEVLERAAETWTGEWWALGGGGTVWDSMAYDPDLGLLYIGVGNGSPWNQQVRSPEGGDNLFLSSIVALDAETGEYVWHYQGTPGETWDYTHTQSIILADLTIRGEERKVLMQAPKNGFFFVIDRTDGSFISAEPYVPVTWAEGYDYETGRPIEVEGARFTDAPATLKPGPYGAHNWQPMAFNPKTGLAYIPALSLEGLYQTLEPYEVEKGRYNTGTDLAIASLPDDEAQRKAMKHLIRGHLSAWDPVKQEEAWRVPYDYSWNGGVMTTAGNLVFQGTADAHLKAYAADTGEELWSAPAQTGIIAGPVSYEVEGEQYISVMAGWGGAFGLTAAYFAPEINQFKVSRVLTFKLGGDKTLPPLDMTLPPFPEPPAQTASQDTLAEGRYLYHRFCQFCHGDKAVARGVVVDLRRSSSLHDPDWWKEIVIDGALKENGMVSFTDNITAEDADAIRHYVIQRAHESIAERAEAE